MRSLGNLAEMELRYGDPQLGRQLILQNIEFAREVGFTWWEAGKHITLAEHALMSGDLAEAERRTREGPRLERRLTDRAACVVCLALLAASAAGRGDPERAGRLWGAVEAEERNGAMARDWEEVERKKYAAHVESVVGPAFEQGRAEGARLSFGEAIEYALATA